jgi:3-hydroxyisobutyrate dehydrogenase-like beta-hydroxyacid dehydrogenase
VLEDLGTPRHLGPQGAGAAMKLVANVCLGVLMTGLGEALAFSRALGLDPGDVLDVLAESPIGATVRSKRSNIESGDWPANFKLELAAKDLRLVQAEAARLELHVADAARRWLEAAEAAGLGECDYSAVIEKILVSSES